MNRHSADRRHERAIVDEVQAPPAPTSMPVQAQIAPQSDLPIS